MTSSWVCNQIVTPKKQPAVVCRCGLKLHREQSHRQRRTWRSQKLFRIDQETTMKKTLLCLMCLLCPLFLRAQIANNTSLVGTVFDPSGLPVASAHVIATEEQTKVTSEATTNDEGYYAITFILPGTYDITVEQQGFKKIIKTGVTVAIKIAARTDFTLAVGSEGTTLTVTARTPPLSTDDSSLSETFPQQTVEELPVSTQNALD